MIDETNIEKYMDRIIKKLGKSVMKYTCQIFWVNEDRIPDPIGTGVFLECNNKKFLITAAHNFKFNPLFIYSNINQSTNLEIYLKNDNEDKVDVTFISSKSSNAPGHSSDNCDIAIIELQSDFLSKIDYSFLTYENIKINLEPNRELIFVLFGYPLSKTKVKPGEMKIKNKSPMLYYGKISSPEKYKQNGYGFDYHILVDYTRRDKYNNLTVHPRGVSGGGLWYLPKLYYENGEDIPILLSGIFIEYHENFEALVSTRIDIVTEYLNRYKNCDFPRSKTNIKF